MKQPGFSIRKRIKSFAYAISGLKILLKDEHNARIHLVAAVGVLIASMILKLSVFEWIAVIFSIGLVITAEIMNSAIEKIADFISPEKHETIKKIKDLAAAGVLVSAITALIIGLIIFVPRIVHVF